MCSLTKSALTKMGLSVSILRMNIFSISFTLNLFWNTRATFFIQLLRNLLINWIRMHLFFVTDSCLKKSFSDHICGLSSGIHSFFGSECFQESTALMSNAHAQDLLPLSCLQLLGVEGRTGKEYFFFPLHEYFDF